MLTVKDDNNKGRKYGTAVTLLRTGSPTLKLMDKERTAAKSSQYWLLPTCDSNLPDSSFLVGWKDK